MGSEMCIRDSFTIDGHNFLQRYNSLHSQVMKEGIRYLTRTKLSGSIYLIRNHNHILSVVADYNKRSLRADTFKSIGWSSVKIGVGHNNYSFNLGSMQLGNNNNINMDGEASYKVGRYLFKSSFSHIFRPSHISLSDTIYVEEKNQFIIDGEWSHKRINIGAHIYLNNYQGNTDSANNEIILPNIGSNIWFSGCLLYTSPSPRDGLLSRMPSSA